MTWLESVALWIAGMIYLALGPIACGMVLAWMVDPTKHHDFSGWWGLLGVPYMGLWFGTLYWMIEGQGRGKG